MKVPFKWLIIGIGLLYYAEIGQAAPGRKIRLRQYEVKFGTWPLMEITKLQKKPRHKFRPLGGFMKHAIPSNFQVHQGLQLAINQQSSNIGGIKNVGNIGGIGVNNGNIGGYQSVSSQNIGGIGVNSGIGGYSSISSPPALTSGFPNGQPQTIIFIPPGAPSPLASLGSPSMNFPTIVNGGPAPIQVQGPSSNFVNSKPKEVPKKSSLRSLFANVMGGAAYSGYFDQKTKAPKTLYKENNYNSQSNYRPGPPSGGYFGGFSNNNNNNFRPGPPPGMKYNPPIIDISNGQISGGFRPGPPPGGFTKPMVFHPPPAPLMVGHIAPNARHDMEMVPKVPPVITIGSHPPDGYSMVHGEQQLITLKLPNARASSRMDLEDLLAGAEYKVGEGSNWYRRDGSDTSESQVVEKKLPEVGAIYTVNMVLQTPNISAPMNGSHSIPFQQGMNEMKRIYSNNKQSPLDSQVKLLGKLFTELQRLKPPKVTSSADSETNSASSRIDYHSKGPWLKGDGKPRVDAPVMAVHIQSYSVPEPASSDPDVLDSVNMFGLPGHRFEFGNTNEIINLMDTAQKADASRILLNELGNNQREVNDNLQEWIKAYVSLTRKVNHEAHAKGENIASKSFRQHQYYMPPNGYNPGGYPVDPKMFSQGAAITNAGAVATYRG